MFVAWNGNNDTNNTQQKNSWMSKEDTNALGEPTNTAMPPFTAVPSSLTKHKNVTYLATIVTRLVSSGTTTRSTVVAAVPCLGRCSFFGGYFHTFGRRGGNFTSVGHDQPTTTTSTNF
jgi:hypothetical protein